MTETLDNNHRNDLDDYNSILILGILSILFFTAIGLVLSIATIYKSNKTLRTYHGNPARYSIKSYKRVRIGKILGITGLISKFIVIPILLGMQTPP